MKKYILGIDIGTSGTKTILVDDEGRVAAAKTVEYPLETPKPGWTQQNPADWWQAAAESIRAVLEKSKVPGDQIAGKDTVTALCFSRRISAACMEEHTERSALVCLHSLSGKPCDHTG